jgi:hypothetical protein
MTQTPQTMVITSLKTLDDGQMGLVLSRLVIMPHAWAGSLQAGQSTPELLCTEDGGRCLWRHLGIT